MFKIQRQDSLYYSKLQNGHYMHVPDGHIVSLISQSAGSHICAISIRILIRNLKKISELGIATSIESGFMPLLWHFTALCNFVKYPISLYTIVECKDHTAPPSHFSCHSKLGISLV